MEVALKDLTGEQIEYALKKHNCDISDAFTRLQKLRLLAQRGIAKVYIPKPPKQNNNVRSSVTQTYTMIQKAQSPAPVVKKMAYVNNDYFTYSPISYTKTTRTTGNVVVTDENVHNYGVQRDMVVNGNITLGNRVINTKALKIDVNIPYKVYGTTLNIIMDSTYGPIVLKCVCKNEVTITVSASDLQNKHSGYVYIKNNSAHSIVFKFDPVYITHNTHVVSAHTNVSFAYYVMDNNVYVRWINKTNEAIIYGQAPTFEEIFTDPNLNDLVTYTKDSLKFQSITQLQDYPTAPSQDKVLVRRGTLFAWEEPPVANQKIDISPSEYITFSGATNYTVTIPSDTTPQSILFSTLTATPGATGIIVLKNIASNHVNLKFITDYILSANTTTINSGETIAFKYTYIKQYYVYLNVVKSN